MSFNVPSEPKLKCQNRQLWLAIASRTSVGTADLPWKNIPFHAAGQSFHAQSKQSMDPIHPGNPDRCPSSRSWLMSSKAGCQSASSPFTSFTAMQNRFMASNPVDDPVRYLSSSCSIYETPDESCWWTDEATFWSAERPNLPAASSFCRIYSSWPTTLITMSSNSLIGIRKECLK